MKIRPTQKRGRVLVEVDRKDEPLLADAKTPETARAPVFALDRILVPTDFSECSRQALQYAVPLARQFRSRLTLLYVMPVQYFVGSEFGPMDFPLPEAELRQSSERELAAMARREVGDRIPVETQVCRGQPVHEIVRVAKEGRADLIILSTHGRTGLKHVLLGSVAENVVRYAPCPVLVVRGQELESAHASSAARRPKAAR